MGRLAQTEGLTDVQQEILAAVNEEVEWSYRVNLALILIVVFILSYMTYVSVIGALILLFVLKLVVGKGSAA